VNLRSSLDGKHPDRRRLQGRYGAPQNTPKRRLLWLYLPQALKSTRSSPPEPFPRGARNTGPGPDDEFLVALAKNGRTDAYDQLVRRYRRFVRVKSSSYFLLGGDADDLMQEGLLGLFKAIRDYRPEREASFAASPSSASPGRSSRRSRPPPATSTRP